MVVIFWATEFWKENEFLKSQNFVENIEYSITKNQYSIMVMMSLTKFGWFLGVGVEKMLLFWKEMRPSSGWVGKSLCGLLR